MRPQVRRVVTGHNEQGVSGIYMDNLAPPVGRGVLVWTTSDVPADNLEPYDGSGEGQVSTAPSGAHFFKWTFAPRHVSAMHRTETIDYVYVISGRVDLILEDDVRVPLSEGDAIIQRGTNHGWENPTDEPCTMIATAIRALPLDLNNPTATPAIHAS